VVEMDEDASLRYEGVKCLYKALLRIFDCYGINSDNKENLNTDFEYFDNEIRRIEETNGSTEFAGRFDMFDRITCHLASDAYNAFEKRAGKEGATKLYNAVILGRHDLLKDFVGDKEF
jgi:hypothetical protein